MGRKQSFYCGFAYWRELEMYIVNIFVDYLESYFIILVFVCNTRFKFYLHLKCMIFNLAICFLSYSFVKYPTRHFITDYSFTFYYKSLLNF